MKSRVTFRVGAYIHTDPPGALPDPSIVTTATGIAPTRSHRPGDRKGPRAAPFKHGQWALDPPLGEEVPLEDKLQWLLDRLIRVRAEIVRIVATDQRLQADFFCGISLQDDNEGLGLPASIVRDIALLDADVNFDIYWTPDDAAAPTD